MSETGTIGKANHTIFEACCLPQMCKCDHVPFASRPVQLKINSLIVLNSALNEFCNSIKCILALNSVLVEL